MGRIGDFSATQDGSNFTWKRELVLYAVQNGDGLALKSTEYRMPYEEHPDFKAPENPDAKIWRYMNLAKFLSMLEGQSLYFSRLDVLAEKDPYEGLYTNLNARALDLKYADLPKEAWEQRGIDSEETWAQIRDLEEKSRGFVKVQRQMSFANSWCVSEHESAAMWPLYIEGSEGIAVQSTYNHLVECIKKYDEFNIFIGKIRYMDYNTEVIPVGQLLLPLITKRKSFEHEIELRALIWTLQHGKNKIVDNKFASTLGLSVPVDLDVLIEKIYVSPEAPDWLLILIQAMVDRFQLDKPVKQSDLASDPLY
jgi:hypothetical protein